MIHLKNQLIILLFLAMLMGCSHTDQKKSYENQQTYDCTLGSEVKIFASTNSCCKYCLSNESQLKHTQFLKRDRVDNGPEDCVGCSWTDAYVFKATSVGVDTVTLQHLRAPDDCGDEPIASFKYVIHVE